jgi:hypothetical protein
VDDGWFDRDGLGVILRKDALWAPLPATLEQRVLLAAGTFEPRTERGDRAVSLDVHHLNHPGESS